jgi:hypothetical protein
MGGYAAILFGNMINADLCLAFSPQTFIDEKNRNIRKDGRHPEGKSRVCAETKHPEMLDLKKYLASRAAKTCNIIFFDDQLRIDKIHAKRMSKLDSFHLFTAKGMEHNPGKYLHHAGILDRLFGQVLTLKDIPDSIIALLKSEPLISEYDDTKHREKEPSTRNIQISANKACYRERESPSLAKGVRLRLLSLRGSRVRIPPPAPFYHILLPFAYSTSWLPGVMSSHTT